MARAVISTPPRLRQVTAIVVQGAVNTGAGGRGQRHLLRTRQRRSRRLGPVCYGAMARISVQHLSLCLSAPGNAPPAHSERWSVGVTIP